MQFPSIDDKPQSILLLMAASGVLYAGSRLAVHALARPDGSDTGRRALAQWIPIAVTAIVAILWSEITRLVDKIAHKPTDNNPQLQLHLASIAVSIVFGTSVALLSLVAGMTTWLAPLHDLPPSRKVWPFIMPVALLLLMAGFSAHLTWWHGLMLLGLGGAIVPVWRSAPEVSDGSSERPLAFRPATCALLAVVAICAVGAIMAVRGTLVSSIMTSHSNRLLTPGTLAATIVSPLLVLSTLGTASSVAQRGYPGRALTALVGTVLLNLCLLLPVLIFLWYLKTSAWKFSGFLDFRAPWESVHALPYDRATWRIETVILVVLGFAMVPLSMGRWALGKVESALLVVAYAGYIVMLALFGLQLL